MSYEIVMHKLKEKQIRIFFSRQIFAHIEIANNTIDIAMVFLIKGPSGNAEKIK